MLQGKQATRSYAQDLIHCPALAFAIGNIVYGAFLGSVAGFEVGALAACTIQTAIAGYTAARQINATYHGSDFAAPFRSQAYANWLTVAGLLYTGVTHPVALNMVILPMATFSLWGKGHWDVANAMDREALLQNSGAAAAAIVSDPVRQKSQRRYLMQYGIAETLAPLKQMPADQVVQTFETLMKNPALLSWGQVFSLLPLPLFILGLYGAVRHRSFEAPPQSNPMARLAHRLVRPNNLYAAGYAVGAVLSAVSGNFLFAGAQAFWSFGYNRLSVAKPEPQPANA